MLRGLKDEHVVKRADVKHSKNVFKYDQKLMDV